MFLLGFFLMNLFLLAEIFLFISFVNGIKSNQQQIQIFSKDNFNPIEIISKRAFDRVDVSTFDFNKRFNDIEDNLSPLGKLFVSSKQIQQLNKSSNKIKLPIYETKIKQLLTESSYLNNLKRQPSSRIYGFGIFSRLK
ncbi:hypothetical protein Mgra_00002760 [Meloidogyne graminicola]|uniref:Uncharacterized protein n=1 Tax=Meloidogyne graminicola TaxID=189291 RepID=A0A8S9ZW05_9BILA|nr:hypothetical protein Mgra_00002760 [Meloidogyne graminicola]